MQHTQRTIYGCRFDHRWPDWRQTLTAIDGLIFDLDNTLLDRYGAFRGVAESFYDEHLSPNTSVARDEAVAMMMRWDGDGYNDREGMLRRWLSEWPDAGLAMDSLTRWYRAEMERQVEPDAEVNGFLALLNERRMPWGIVTNGSPSQHGKCRKAGLDELAPFIIVSEEAGYRKPDPRIFQDALEATGLADPGQIMFVGDNPEADIDGAKRFGMKAAWVRRGRQYPPDLMPPDHVIDHVTEVRDIVSPTQ